MNKIRTTSLIITWILLAFIEGVSIYQLLNYDSEQSVFSSKKASKLGITVIIITALCVLWLPRTVTVKGTITDWIGNENGFGIKINGEIYWLDYSGEFNSTVPFASIVGHDCELVYESNLILPRGTDMVYAHCISLTIF